LPRPPKCRRVEFQPEFTYFKPAGIPKHQLEELVLSVEEIEAIRLKDRESLEQEECAERMHISRPTFQRILSGARKKLAEAIIEGKAIKIKGGNYRIAQPYFHCKSCKHEFEAPHIQVNEHKNKNIVCPKCSAGFAKNEREPNKAE